MLVVFSLELGALFGFDLRVNLAFFRIGTQNRAHDQVEDAANQNRWNERKRYVYENLPSGQLCLLH